MKTDSAVLIRRATVNDAETISELYQIIYGNNALSGLDVYPEPDLFNAKGVSKLIEVHDVYTAFVHGEIAACLIVYNDDCSQVIFDDLVVAPLHRKKGLASSLIQSAVEQFTQSDTLLAVAQTITSSPYSQAAFAQSGFPDIVGLDLYRYPVVYRAGVHESTFIHRRFNKFSISFPEAAKHFSGNQKVYIPALYQEVVRDILAPEHSWCERTLVTSAPHNSSLRFSFSIEHQEHAAIVRISLDTPDTSASIEHLQSKIDDLKRAREYILVLTEVQHPVALAVSEALNNERFIFHSFLLGGETPFHTGKRSADILSLQWIAPSRVLRVQNAIDSAPVQVADQSSRSVSKLLLELTQGELTLESISR